MGDDGDNNGGGGWGSNNNYSSSNNNYAESYNNYSYKNDENDFPKYNSYNDTKSNEDTRSYSAYKPYEPTSKSYDDSTVKPNEPPSKVSEESAKTFEETRKVFEETRPEPSTPAPAPPIISESYSYVPKTESKESETKKSIVDDFGGGDDDDDDDLKFKKDTPNENITVTTAEINTPPGATCDHKTLAVLLGSVTAGHLSEDAAEMEALASLHDACKCNGDHSRVAADGIDLDDTRESMDLLNDSSETRPVDTEEKKPVEEDDCLLDVLTFCVTCCECVIS